MGIARRTTATADDYSAPAERETDGTVEETESAPTAKRGWKAAKEKIAETSSFSESFKIPNVEDNETPALIKFLEGEPYATVGEHWVDEITKGKRSFYCLGKKACPLCLAGHQPKSKSFFNVQVVGESEVRLLEAGPGLTKDLEREDDSRLGPLSKHYWEISRSGGGRKGPVKYKLNGVKAAELAEDFGLDADDVAASHQGLKLLDEESVRYPKRTDLEEIVETYLTD